MSTQQNSDRIQTTHIGSLPRPHDLLDLMKAKLTGQAYDQKKYDDLVAKSVADSVRKQAECGIDIVSEARNELTQLDEDEPEEIERFRKTEQRNQRNNRQSPRVLSGCK